MYSYCALTCRVTAVNVFYHLIPEWTMRIKYLEISMTNPSRSCQSFAYLICLLNVFFLFQTRLVL